MAHGLPSNGARTLLAHPAMADACSDLAARAEGHYAAAAKAITAGRSPGTWFAGLILASYQAILQELRARGWKRLERPVRLSTWRRAVLAMRYALAMAKSFGT